jgi:serine/threonine protein phosphatase PrpC
VVYFDINFICDHLIFILLLFFHITQAYNLSRDHKPELEAERERIQSAGGYIQMGRVNGTLNLSRAIGILSFFFYLLLFVHTSHLT